MRADAHYVEQLVSQSADQPVRMVSIDEMGAPESIRQADLEPLIASIRAHGVLSPLLVRREASRYKIIAGRRRFAAAQIAGLAAVPCLLHQVDEAGAEALARADNLRARSSETADGSYCTEMVTAVQRSIAESLASVESIAAVLGAGTPPMRRGALDLMRAHVWRSARLLDALNVIDNAPVPASRGRALAKLIDLAVEGFVPESRLSGVTMRALVPENVPSVIPNDHELLAGLCGALLATLPLVENVEQSTVVIRVAATGSGPVMVDIAQTAVAIPASLAGRFFDETLGDRPGGWCAAAGAVAVKEVAERYGGSASLATGSNGAGGIRILLLRRS